MAASSQCPLLVFPSIFLLLNVAVPQKIVFDNSQIIALSRLALSPELQIYIQMALNIFTSY